MKTLKLFGFIRGCSGRCHNTARIGRRSLSCNGANRGAGQGGGGVVRFENVGLRYGLGPEVLRDLSFQIEPHSFQFLFERLPVSAISGSFGV